MGRYSMRDEGGDTKLEARSKKLALQEAKELLRSGDYGPISSTIWMDAWIVDDETGEDVGHVTVAIDPQEPRCPKGKHKWIEKGVQGSGGGVIVKEECPCGEVRFTNTWAQRRDTGEQGLTSVHYPSLDNYE